MKLSLTQLLKNRAVQASASIAAIVFVAATSASSGSVGARMKLEGAWIAMADNGARGMVTYGPSDPSGQRAAFHNHLIFPLALLAGMGLDGVTDEVAEEFMTSNNTSSYTGIWYGLAKGDIVAIFIDNTSATFHSPTKRTNQHTISVYPVAVDTDGDGTMDLFADADNDGYPDPDSGIQPLVLNSTSSGTRVIH